MCFACDTGFVAGLAAMSWPSRRQTLTGAGTRESEAFLADAILAAGHAEGKSDFAVGGALVGAQPARQGDPVTIYPARKIITMEPSNPTATAIAVAGQRILAAGTLDQVKAAVGSRPFNIDERFASKIVMPGFIDQHLHPVLGALTLAMEVIAPEDWHLPAKEFRAANDAVSYRERLKAAETQLQNSKDWLLTWGYQPLWHGKLDRKALDDVSNERPIAVWHRSCHEFFLNTAALTALGLSKTDTEGKGLWSAQSNWEEGHFWEGGLNLMMAPMLKVLATPERLAFGLRQLVAYEHANGVTAYNEPGALYTPAMWTLYEQILGAPDTPMYSTFLADGRGIPDRVGLAKALEATEQQIAVAPDVAGRKLMFFPKQIKLFADGAIISQLMQMKDGYLDGHSGEWIILPDELERRFKLYWDAGYQPHIHVNGDLGLEVVLDILERRMQEHPRADHRTVIVHFANSTEEQVDRIARLGAIVSANPYYPVGFADKFSNSGLGPERANAMVRANSVLRRGISLSYHSDMPMGPSNPLYLAWCGVNRITASGRVAGAEQRIAVEAALRAITIDAAFSWRKENELGSIVPGKIANLTVLEKDPLEVDPLELKDIAIWGTMFEGRVFPVSTGAKSGRESFAVQDSSAQSPVQGTDRLSAC